MKTNVTATTETYAAAYNRLSQIAEKLKSAGTVNIDEIVADLRSARAAHAVCKARLDAIRREVDAEVEAAEGTATA